MFCRYLCVILSFGHCIVCRCLVYVFWPLVIVLSVVVQCTDSDLWSLYCLSLFSVRLLTFGHCIVCSWTVHVFWPLVIVFSVVVHVFWPLVIVLSVVVHVFWPLVILLSVVVHVFWLPYLVSSKKKYNTFPLLSF